MHILIAKDEAFNFTYKANIDALMKMGDVSFFSPLHDDVPILCDLLYLPGGYPELFLSEISANIRMCARIREYADRGGCIMAECGGFMYLCHDIDGIPMCNVFPFSATMKDARLHLGYRQMSIPSPTGSITVRGHEFHYSDLAGSEHGHEFHQSNINDTEQTTHPSITKTCCQYSARNVKVPTALYRYNNVAAGYTHWYWAEASEPFLSFLFPDMLGCRD